MTVIIQLIIIISCIENLAEEAMDSVMLKEMCGSIFDHVLDELVKYPEQRFCI